MKMDNRLSSLDPARLGSIAPLPLLEQVPSFGIFFAAQLCRIASTNLGPMP
jgi:hypothetical protein